MRLEGRGSMAGSEMEEIVAAIRDQWVSMAGMAAMFTLSIGFGIFIQPLYNFEGARAFGEEGTTQASNILLELLMIFMFIKYFVIRKNYIK